MVQGAGGEDVVDSLRLPSTVRQASLLPGQPETAEPAVKAIEEESESYFFLKKTGLEENVPQKQMLLFPTFSNVFKGARSIKAAVFWVLYIK